MLKKGNKWWILLVTTTATALFLLDSTLIPVALPAIQRDLGFSDVSLMWVSNAYLLALSAFLLIGGRLCEILGFRLLFNVGLALFGVGAVMAGLSHTASTLLLSRVVQGVGSACAFPATAALLVSAFPRNECARALGVDTGIASLFMLIGPLVGGILTQYLSWRLLFFFYVPFVLLGLTMSLWLVKKGEVKKERLPLLPSLFMVMGITAFVVGLMESNSLGWSNSWILLLTILGLLFMGFFVVLSLFQKQPLADFTLFKNPLYLGAASCRFIAYFIVSGTALWVIHFEKILSYTPTEIGVFVIAAALPVIALAPIAGILADKYGFRPPLIWGFTFLLLGLLWLACFAHTHNLWIYLPGLCAFGMSLPFVMAPTLGLGLTVAPAHQLGGASGMMMSVRQLASTLGVAVMTAAYYSFPGQGFIATVIVAALCAGAGILTSLLLVSDAKVGDF